MQDQLPPAFQQYASQVQYIQRHGDNKWSSSCPHCGGDIHQEAGKVGEWPDRCVWFLDDKPLGYCFRCTTIFWPDKAPGYVPPSAEEITAWRTRREAELEERKSAADERLEKLRSTEFWQQYHDHMDEQAKQYWRNRGISNFWQDWWHLGWQEEYRFSSHGDVYMRPAATIPLFGADWQFLNLKLRLIDPPDGASKYRYYLSGQPAPLFLCNPEMPLEGHVYAIEGELKAAVTFAHIDNSDTLVVGMPGSVPPKQVIAQLAQMDRVTLIMDPDAKKQSIDLARAIGLHKTYIIIPPEKIDDAIIRYSVTTPELRRYLRYAPIKASAFIRPNVVRRSMWLGAISASA